MLNGCYNLKSINFSNIKFKLEQMSELFIVCAVLENINLSNFDTERVIDMNRFFSNYASLTTLVYLIQY